MNTLALQVLGRDSRTGNRHVFGGRRGDLVWILWHDGPGKSPNAKRLERGRLPWPSTADGALSTGVAQPPARARESPRASSPGFRDGP